MSTDLSSGRREGSDRVEISKECGWWSFATASRVTFGVGASRCLGQAVRSVGNRAVLCTDRNIVDAGIIDALLDGMRDEHGVEVLVFDEGREEVGLAYVEDCVDAVREFAPRVVVGVGGGSDLDLAKVMAVRLVSDRPVVSWPTEAGVPSGALPMIAVPTTAGTGSEVTRIAVMTDESAKSKVGMSSDVFLPTAALVDPLLTLSCPPSVTAYSGMDAITHAIEAYLAVDYRDRAMSAYGGQGFVGKNPLSDVLALRAVGLIGEHLVRAYKDGSDVEARTAMALGSLFAGMAFSSAGTSVVHALQYPIGAVTGTAHGLGNALLLPAAVRFSLGVRRLEAGALARQLGATAEGDDEAAEELPRRLEALARAVGIARSLRSIGVEEGQLPAIAKVAFGIRRLVENSARPVDEADLLDILRDAFAGSPGAAEKAEGR